VGFARADEVTAGLAQAHQMMQKGDYAKAIDIITNVIASGKAQADMAAKALLMRGQAREKLGKKAFALADYNQALWMQGLSENEKKLAEAGKARIQGGLGVQEPSRTIVSEVPRQETASSFSVSSTPAPAPAPSPSPSPSPSSYSTSLASEPATPTAARQMRTATLGFDQSPPPESQNRSSGGGIGGFFSSLFGGSETSTSQQQESTAVAVISPDVRSPALVQQRQQNRPSRVISNASANASSWNSQTAQASTPSSGSYVDNLSGHFAIQFAALLSEDKAIYEVNRVTRRYGQALDGRSPSIRIIGTRDGDTLYKIVAGPYETMAESTAKCNELKTVGVQCMVISVK
jgi:hypothetical protein